MKYTKEEAIEVCINHLSAVSRIASDYKISMPYLLEKAGIICKDKNCSVHKDI